MFYDKIISLGMACEPARNIKTMTGQTETYPFDWLITPYDSLLSLIENNLNDFCNREDLVFLQPPEARFPQIRNRRWGTIYIHDFDLSETFIERFEKVREKYNRRVARMRSACCGNKSILFIRQAQLWDGVTNLEQSEALLDRIRKSFPDTKASLLVANPPFANIKEYSKDGLTMANLIPPEPYSWTGNPCAWRAMLQEHAGLAPEDA